MPKQKHNKRHSCISFHHTVVLKTVASFYHAISHHNGSKQTVAHKKNKNERNLVANKKQVFMFPWTVLDPQATDPTNHRSFVGVKTCKERGSICESLINLTWQTWSRYLGNNCMPKPPFKILVLTQTKFPCQFCRAELSNFCWAFFERMQICFPGLSPFLGRSSQLDCFCSYLKLMQTGDCSTNTVTVHPKKLTWPRKTNHFEMYLLLKIVMFHCHLVFWVVNLIKILAPSETHPTQQRIQSDRWRFAPVPQVVLAV